MNAALRSDLSPGVVMPQSSDAASAYLELTRGQRLDMEYGFIQYGQRALPHVCDTVQYVQNKQVRIG